MNKEVYISFHNVCKYYKGIKAVNNLSLKIYNGDIYGFLGPNGAGKSTSIRMMLSLIEPTSGSIQLFDRDIKKDRNNSLQKIGALIEKPDFYNYLTARKNLEILGKLSGISNLQTKTIEVLELVGLLSRAESKVKTFSQGMRQRLGIAQTLLHDPKLIILDEPSNGLDPQGQKEIRSLIKNLNIEKGITIVISSHMLAEIEQIANRMIIINDGKTAIEGNVNELLLAYGMNVKIEVDNAEKALEYITNSIWQDTLIKQSGTILQFRLDKEQIPEIISFLSEKHIKIYNIDPKRSLEEYFISKTKEDTSMILTNE